MAVKIAPSTTLASLHGSSEAGWDEDCGVVGEVISIRMIAVNLKSVWLCMKHEIHQMQPMGGGSIVNTSSILGLVGLSNGVKIIRRPSTA